MSRQSFVRGAILLSAASLLSKALSAVFKIPLDRFFIGAEGIAIYQSAYTIFNWMLAVGGTGIPMAVSNLVADSDEETAAGIRSSALWLVTGAGVIIGGLLFIFAGPVAAFIAGDAPAFYAIRVMAPAIAFLGIVSAYRGYFQGRGNMLPSAVSQIADSFCKAGVGLGVCALLVSRGNRIAAAGAMSGVTVGTILGACVLLAAGRKYITVRRPPSAELMRKIVMLSIPVTLGAAGFACVMLSDTLTVQNILTRSGFSPAESEAQFGYLTRAFMVYNLPAALISAVTVSVAPASAEAFRRDDRELLHRNAVSAVKIIMFVSVPCMLGVVSFPKEILELLYKGGAHSEPLVFTGILMLLIPFTQVLSGILQATGCVWKPIGLLGLTVGVKTVLNFILIPEMGVMGAPFATVIAYGMACVAFIYLFRRHMGFGFPVGVLLRPVLAAAVGVLCGKGVYALKSTALGFLAAVTVTAAVYLVLAVLLKAVDISMIKRDKNGK